jgi:hypothetical protein
MDTVREELEGCRNVLGYEEDMIVAISDLPVPRTRAIASKFDS